MSVNYNDKFIAAPSTITDLNVDTALTGRTSKTFFTGGQADEIADYTLSYRVGTTTLRSTAINFYWNNAATPVMKRATDSTVTSQSALAMSVNYNDKFIAAPSTITD